MVFSQSTFLSGQIDLLSIVLTIIIGVVVFVLADIALDMFGISLKDRIARLLPEGTITKQGEIKK